MEAFETVEMSTDLLIIGGGMSARLFQIVKIFSLIHCQFKIIWDFDNEMLTTSF